MSLYPYPISHASFVGDGPPLKPEPPPRVPPKQETTAPIHFPISSGLPDGGQEDGGTVVATLRPTKTKYIGAKALRLFIDVPEQGFERASESFNAADLQTGPTQEGAFWFAPGTDAPRVGWKVSQPEKVKKVTFELRCRGGKVVCTKELTDVAFLKQNPWESRGLLEKSAKRGRKKLHLHGSKPLSEIFTSDDIKNASIDGKNPFPAGLLTVEHSPYKLEMKIEAEEGEKAVWPTRAWTYFHVLLGDIELSFFPADVLDKVIPAENQARDKEVYEKLIDVNDRDNLAGRFPKPPKWSADGKLLAKGETKRVPLRSDTFYSAYQDLVNNAAFERHQHLWGDGPNLPILARPKVRTAQDKLVDATDLLGAARFLWDYADKAPHFKGQIPGYGPIDRVKKSHEEDVDPHLIGATRPRSSGNAPPDPAGMGIWPIGWTSERATSGYDDPPITSLKWLDDKGRPLPAPQEVADPATEAFLKDSQDYYSATDDEDWSPPGFNCHVDRGGKRGPKAKPIFPAQPGLPDEPDDLTQDGVFPFKVESLAGNGLRRWTAVSTAWTKGKYKGCTGVVFQPSRMAGDGYELHVQLAYSDVPGIAAAEAEPASTRLHGAHQASGRFQVWREVTILNYIKLGTGIPDMSADWLDRKFAPAYVCFRRKYDTIIELKPTDKKWLDGVKAVKDDATLLPEYIRHAIDVTTPDATKPVTFVNYREWRRRVKASLGVDPKKLDDEDTDQVFFDWGARQKPTTDWTGALHPAVWTGPGYPIPPVCPAMTLEFVTADAPNTTNAKEGEVKVKILDAREAVLTFPNPKIGHRKTTLDSKQKAEIEKVVKESFSVLFGQRVYTMRVEITALTGNDRRTARFENVKKAIQEAFDKHHFSQRHERSDGDYGTYAQHCKYGWVFEVTDAVMRKAFTPDGAQGLNLLHCPWGGPPLGKSKASAVTHDESKSAQLSLAVLWATVDQAKNSTVGHEVAHCLFLCHTFASQIASDPRELSQEQPPTNGSLMMATGGSDDNTLCGFERLRLRGWSIYKIGPDGKPVPTPPLAVTLDPADLPAHCATWTWKLTDKTLGQVEVNGSTVKYTAKKKDGTDVTDADVFDYFVYDTAGLAAVKVRVKVTIVTEGEPDPASNTYNALNVKPGQEVSLDVLAGGKHPAYGGIRTLWKRGASNKAPGGDPQPEWASGWDGQKDESPLI